MITLRTKRYAVFETAGHHKKTCLEDLVVVRGGQDGKYLCASFARKMQQYGSCILRDVVSEDVAVEATVNLTPLVNALCAMYDAAGDEFEGVDLEALGIVRLPRIGRGKHNVHLDPYESDCHAALVRLLEASGICALLSEWTGKTCSVRETGFSLTTARGGEGMEWHSDGSEGEYTVLMALVDVTQEQGTLGVVPGSHLAFVPGRGHGDIAHNDYSDADVRYAYRAGQPIVNDARTIHGVDRNSSDRWRVVTWYILDVY